MMSAAYSLLELIFSMAILFILISAATISPSMIVLEYRLDHYAQNLINSLRLARSKALHQVETVSLCPSKDGIICTKEQYELGWILFHDHQLPRGQREQSKEALMQQQQNYYSQHQRYQVDIEIEQDLNNSDESESDKKTVVSQHGYYLITVAACEDDESNQCVILKATPREMGAALLHYSLDSKNRKSPESKW